MSLLHQPNMPLSLKIAQYEPKTPDEHVEGLSFILPLEGRNGYVFVLVYINKKNPDTETLLQIIGDQVHRLVNAFGLEANAQHRFEQFLSALNETLAQYVREGRFSIPIQSFHALVGIVCEERMFLSGTGELCALFLHRKQTQRYQVFNLFRGIQTEQALPSWEKPFAVVLDGDMTAGDVLCISQKNLQNAIATDELNAILTTLPPKSAVEKIRQEFGYRDGILLMILKSEKNHTNQTETHATLLSDVSINAFVDTQDETMRLLEDQKPDIIKTVRQFVIHFFRSQVKKSRLLSKIKQPEPLAKTILKLSLSLIQKVSRLSARFLKRFIVLIISFSKKDTRTRTLKELQEKTKNIQQHTQHFTQKIRTLPKRARIQIVIVLFLLILLIIGLFLLSQARTNAREQSTYNQNRTVLENIVEQAGGAMIYKDENQARILYQNAIELLSRLPTNTPARAEIAKKLSLEIQTSLNNLRHIISIPNPVQVGVLPPENSDLQGARLFQFGSILFIFGTDQNVYQFNSEQNSFNVINTSPITTEKITHVFTNDKVIYLVDAAQHLFAFDPNTKTVTSVSAPLQDGRWINFVAYANRIYAVQKSTDETDSQIIKFNESENTLTTGNQWIVSKSTKLDQIISIAIDGSLYLLKTNGRVIKFQNGAEIGWELGAVDPPIKQATRIVADPDSRFIYLLEPETKRLIVYQKDSGAFVIQYTSDAFVNLKDMVIDEKQRVIYILSGSQIYSITPTHLKN